MTPERFEKIREYDRRTPICEDRCGGRYMTSRMVAHHGQLACIHRRELIKFVEQIMAKLEQEAKA